MTDCTVILSNFHVDWHLAVAHDKKKVCLCDWFIDAAYVVVRQQGLLGRWFVDVVYSIWLTCSCGSGLIGFSCWYMATSAVTLRYVKLVYGCMLLTLGSAAGSFLAVAMW